jgi:hypothetical protein
MKSIIHVNQHRIKANARNGFRFPVVTVKQGKTNAYGHEVVIYGQDGKEAARVVYRPDNPLSCGAKVWIQTTGEVEVIDRSEELLRTGT